MCMLSVVQNEFRPAFPDYRKTVPGPYPWQHETPPEQTVRYTPQEVRELIDAYRQACAAAEAYDRITGQPDCVDPEKAKLGERVDALERLAKEMGA